MQELLCSRGGVLRFLHLGLTCSNPISTAVFIDLCALLAAHTTTPEELDALLSCALELPSGAEESEQLRAEKQRCVLVGSRHSPACAHETFEHREPFHALRVKTLQPSTLALRLRECCIARCIVVDCLLPRLEVRLRFGCGWVRCAGASPLFAIWTLAVTGAIPREGASFIQCSEKGATQSLLDVKLEVARTLPAAHAQPTRAKFRKADRDSGLAGSELWVGRGCTSRHLLDATTTSSDTTAVVEGSAEDNVRFRLAVSTLKGQYSLSGVRFVEVRVLCRM